MRKQCHQILKHTEKSYKLKETVENSCNEDNGDFSSKDVVSGRRSHITEGGSHVVDDFDRPLCDQSHQTLLSADSFLEGDVDKSVVTCEDASSGETKSSDFDSPKEHENTPLIASEITKENSIDEDDWFLFLPDRRQVQIPLDASTITNAIVSFPEVRCFCSF